MAFTADRYYSFPVAKVTKGDDGDLYVEGLATDGSLDHDQQVVDPGWAAAAFGEFFQSGPNIRMAHDGTRPVGVGVDWRQDGQGGIWLKSCIVDPLAQRMVHRKVLRAYSVGISRPTITPDPVAKGGRIVQGSLTEVSLVDRPSNRNAFIEIAAKAAGGRTVYTGEIHGGSMGTVKVTKSGRVKVTADEGQQLLFDDQAAYEAWLAKQAPRDGVDEITAMFLNSSNPATVAMAEAALGGRGA